MDLTGDSVLFFDCASGASGDMLAAALLDVAARAAHREPAEVLDAVVRPALAAVGVDPTVVTVAPLRRSGFAALSFTVDDRPGFESFDELEAAVNGSSLPPALARDVAGAARRMAAAERAAHGDPPSGAAGDHLHELAGLDTIVDLVAVTALVRHLEPVGVVASPPLLGGGPVQTAHGTLAVPAPAVQAILEGLPTAGCGGDELGELTTPTGAALLAQLVAAFGPLPPGTVLATGHGAGQKELADRPNVLRAVLVATPAAVGDDAVDTGGPTHGAAADRSWGATRATSSDSVDLLETNIDDLSPEGLAYAADRLREAGALDVWMTPAVMKKGRSAVVVHVLAAPADRDRLAALLFRETTTFGLRVRPVERLYLDERRVTVTAAGREIRVRLGLLDGELVTVAPEHDDCAAAAEAAGRPLDEVVAAAVAAARRDASA